MTNLSHNRLRLCGKIADAPAFSHISHGGSFMKFTIIVERLSKIPDTVNVLVNENMIHGLNLKSGDFISVIGELRSFNNKSGIGSRLVICAYAKEVFKCDPEFRNELELRGVICKEPIYRKTPLGREICDIMLAINRRYGRADYLPCIAWGRNAYITSGYPVGASVDILGRIQSRSYIKIIDGIEHPRVAYEVSISSIAENE